MSQKTPSLASSRLALPRRLVTWLKPLVRIAAAEGAPVYLVGGCVRDLLLGKESLDIDIVLEGPAAPVARAAAKSMKARLVSHEAFLTHTLVFADGRHLDIATARMESYPEPAALPVVEPASLQEDLYRRDFSINAIAVSLNEMDFGHVWDAFGGLDDLKEKRLRVLHADSFKDDPTRVFRAARFAGRFGYSLDWRTRECLAEALAQQGPARLSGARLREELVPILMEADPRPALERLQEWDALGFLIPQHRLDKAHHALMGQALKADKRLDALLLRLLCLLYGMPVSKAVGALGSLMFSQKMIEQVQQGLDLLYRLREGTALSAQAARRTGMAPEVRWWVDHALRLKTDRPRPQAIHDWERLHASTPCLTGRDIEKLGYRPGPLFSRILNSLRQARWEGKLRTREEEIRFIHQEFPQHAG